MIHRRDFLKTSGVVAAAACAGVRLKADPLPFPIGLQLYSVRNLLPKDFDGTLHQLSAAGYKEVEAAGYFNKTAPEWKLAMDQAGLRWIAVTIEVTRCWPRLIGSGDRSESPLG